MAYKRKTHEERMKEIEDLTNDMTEKIESYFVSEEALKEHLAFMSNFYNYSLRNMSLIDSQFRGARAVGSFNFWKEKGAFVKKGEKGIKILVPTPVEYFKRNDDWVQTRYANAKEKEQIKKGEIETRKKLFFKIGHVFEYTQTDAREKGLEVSQIFGQYHKDGEIENNKEMLEALQKIADKVGFTILDEPREELGTAKGAAYPYLKEIALNPRNTDYENVTTLIHELAHAKLHTPDTRDKLTTAEREFQAEMVSYVVANRYGIDTENFTLSYLGGWTEGKELKDKENLLNEVRDTAKEFIEVIDTHFSELEKAKVHTVEYTKDSYEELLLIQENNGLSSNVVEFENKNFLEHLKKENPHDYYKYLSYTALNKHESKDGFITELEVKEPLMMIHNHDSEFKSFGEVNNLDFDSVLNKNKEIEYTIALPNGDKPYMVSGRYDKEKYAHPLHHLEKEKIVSKENYGLLEKSYHSVLLNEESHYIGKVAPKIRNEINKAENSLNKKPQFELER